MKWCPGCKQSRSEEEFARSSIRRDGLQSMCKICKRALDAARYQRKKDLYRQRNALRVIATRAAVRELKNKPCVDCKQMHPWYVMDFDHLSDKISSVSAMVGAGLSLSKIKTEIAKCDLVCANCHRIRSHERLRASG
jgi:hypothetical protein